MLCRLQQFLCVFLLLSQLQADTIARLVKIEGNVYIQRLGMSTFSEKGEVGSPLSNGDQIKVGERSFGAVIYVDDRSVIKIRENTKFTFMDTRNSRTLELEYGTLLNDIKKENRTKSFRIQTPVSVASVKGTQFAAIVSTSGVDQFIGKEGLFEVLNMVSGEVVSVGAGQKAVSNASGNLVQAPSSPQEYPQDPEIEDIIELEPEPEIDSQPKSEKNLLEENSPEKVETEVPSQESESEEQLEEANNNEDPIEDPETIDKPDPTPPADPFSMGLGIGSVTLDDVLYNQIALRPEINIGKIGVGLDLVVYVDNEGNVRNDEWDIENDPGVLLDKILYIKYGKKTETIWGKYGSIEGMTLGYGGLMSNYSNMMEFPTVRRVGLNTGLNIGPIGFELFLANLKDLSRGGTVTGMRASYTVSEDIPLTIGINYVSDANMFSALKDKDEDSYPDVFDDFPDSSSIWNDTDGDGIPDPHVTIDTARWDIDADGDNIYDYGLDGDDSISLKATPFSLKDNKAKTTALSFDIGYPVLNSDLITLDLYLEYNKLNFPGFISKDSSFVRKDRSGTGITLPGVRSTLFGFINFSLEYRMINDFYIPQFFDQAYDLNRVTTLTSNNNTIIKTKDMSLFDGRIDSDGSQSSSGLFGSAGFSLFNLVNFTASYANMKSDTTEIKSFSSYLNLNTENIPKISSAMAYFQRNNDDNPFDFENPSINTIMGYSIGYELSKGVNLIWDFKQFYREDGTGSIEPIKQTTIETTFNF